MKIKPNRYDKGKVVCNMIGSGKMLKKTTALLMLLLQIFSFGSCSVPERSLSVSVRAVTSVGGAFATPVVGMENRETLVGAPVAWKGNLLCMTFTQGDAANLLVLDADGSERRLPVHASDFSVSSDGVWFASGLPDERKIQLLRSEDAEPETVLSLVGETRLLGCADGRLLYTVVSSDARRISCYAYSSDSGETALLAEVPLLNGQNQTPAVLDGRIVFLDVDAGRYVFRAVSVQNGEIQDVHRVSLSDAPSSWSL